MATPTDFTLASRESHASSIPRVVAEAVHSRGSLPALRGVALEASCTTLWHTYLTLADFKAPQTDDVVVAVVQPAEPRSERGLSPPPRSPPPRAPTPPAEGCASSSSAKARTAHQGEAMGEEARAQSPAGKRLRGRQEEPRHMWDRERRVTTAYQDDGLRSGMRPWSSLRV
jgi:hypothetical protein